MRLIANNTLASEIAVTADQPLTMSTREIARITKKRHDHVLRDARIMFESLDLAAPRFGASYKDASGKQSLEYLLPQNECLTLVSGYSITLRHKIIQRWAELEQSAQNGLPDFTDPAAAAIAWAEQYQVRQRLEIKVAEDEDKVAFADQVSGAEGDIGIGEAAKRLKIGRNRFFSLLRAMGYLYSHGRENNMPYQRFMRGNGYTEYFTVQPHIYEDSKGKLRQASTPLMTPKGFEVISRRIRESDIAELA